jgi:Phospholipid methyltransferase
MRKLTAVAGSAGFLVVAPGVVAGLVPWWLTRWRAGADYPVPVRVTGALLTGAGAAALLGSFAQFAVEGRGTPAPPAPTEQLVVHGLYRYVHNPMYLAVLAVITGQRLVLGRPVLLGTGRGWRRRSPALCTGMSSPRWPGGMAHNTRRTGRRCRPGGLACPAVTRHLGADQPPASAAGEPVPESEYCLRAYSCIPWRPVKRLDGYDEC